MNGLEIANRRLKTQRLVGQPFDSPESVIRFLGAVQAQDYYGAKWALAQRTAGFTDDSIDKLFDEGTFIRTHVMRPTWHFVMPEDIRWLLQLTAPRVKALMTYYNRKLELDDRLFTRTNNLLTKALEGNNYKTRTELSAVIKSNGIEVNGQKVGHILMQAELDQVICSGPRIGKQFGYALFDERVPAAKALQHDEALAKLASLYFKSHGPASLQDFVWWSGLTIADAKAGMEMVRKEFIEETVDGRQYWFIGSPAPRINKPVVHLLPNYDEYLIAYKGYGAIFNPLKASPNITNALLVHIVVVDGQVVGGWKRKPSKHKMDITTDIFVPLNSDQQTALQAAAKKYSRFLGLPVTLDGTPVI